MGVLLWEQRTQGGHGRAVKVEMRVAKISERGVIQGPARRKGAQAEPTEGGAGRVRCTCVVQACGS